MNYYDEQKNVLKIFKALGMEYKKYLEESFSKLYTKEVSCDEQKREEVKYKILETMQDFGVGNSETLSKINNDALKMIANKYYKENQSNEEAILEEFKRYDAPIEQKRTIVKEYGIWKLAKMFSVSYTPKEVEAIISNYYNSNEIKTEEEVQAVKKRIVEVMEALSVQKSETFDKLETDALRRICKDIDIADEATCKVMRQAIIEYDALDKNKESFLSVIDARIKKIWLTEDNDIFDNIYMNTDIHNKAEIDNAVKFISEKARTKDAKKYIFALRSCSEKNIEKAIKFKKKQRY